VSRRQWPIRRSAAAASLSPSARRRETRPRTRARVLVNVVNPRRKSNDSVGSLPRVPRPTLAVIDVCAEDNFAPDGVTNLPSAAGSCGPLGDRSCRIAAIAFVDSRCNRSACTL